MVCVESCTLAITMMTEDIDMPGRAKRAWYASDVATFDEVWVAASSINNWCADRKGKPGWTSVGREDIPSSVFKSD